MENTSCPVCGSGRVYSVAEIRGVPINCNVLSSTPEEAGKARRGDITLGFCPDCTHIYNTSYEPGSLDYSTSYETSLCYSPVFQDYVRAQAVELIEQHGIYEKDVIEIGCGNGDFLYLMSEFGGNRGVGFDTSFTAAPSLSRDNEKITFIQDHYSEKYAGFMADLICCRQVLEHVSGPRGFVGTIRQAIGSRDDTIVFFEVPNALFTIKDLSIWDIIYEHYSYFSSRSLEMLFKLESFRVRSLKDSYEGQFLCLDAVASSAPAEPEAESGAAERMLEHVKRFSGKLRSKVILWREELQSIENQGKKAVVWGGGSKGVTFLNMLHVNRAIKYVVDLNPRKHGRHVPVTGQEIVHPGFLTGYQPDVIIVMNPIYIEEIWEIVKGLDIKAKILTA